MDQNDQQERTTVFKLTVEIKGFFFYLIKRIEQIKALCNHYSSNFLDNKTEIHVGLHSERKTR